jgi:hypothetical protein
MTVFLIRWFVDGQQVRSLIWKMLHVVGVAFWKVERGGFLGVRVHIKYCGAVD